MYPIKYVENNLVFNQEGECFAYYELVPYNYSFLSPEQKYQVHDNFRQLIAQNREGKIESDKMNFGQNLYQWFLTNAQSLVLLAIVVIGLFLGFKREFSKLIGFLVIALIAVGLVFNASGVKDVLLNLFNRIVGA